ncbi:epimerase [Acetobacter orientalis]|uniref:Epimerase n=1 Tax=Acetobacter orientalis TaxID=146474 RepID=A0A2Z5ZHL0_9PROT|nr:epimerase [Acetobacter orientalis]
MNENAYKEIILKRYTNMYINNLVKQYKLALERTSKAPYF